ncbi:YafY family transcriptional regulator [Nocardia puris]|uniref:helix-turn-helix transcriptional regulator n=1 Tax=Nocardia puris TaxID=208602 RepID=UPI0018955D9C|nr:YafY family protein [Nocardia puris]MBF6213394.1 YafY family transcriptional regulator [Nocardia puris]MBF6369437.1 YafY family transcriptional regulator [Nocardia puris]MBF6462274.1 YafY family transcriptional regulator [Nocardia puris]
MRASRLVQLLLLLQTRGRISAPELAEELEVSVRTVYRDVEALSAAGVPVYSEPGRGGGVRLVDGYRTRLTGLTSEEADAVLLAGLPTAAADLGLGTVLATAQLKVLAALPPELRGRATRIAERVHLDAPGWFHQPEETPTLAVVADALWHDRRLDLRYGREREVRRLVDPLGLVSKAGTWYLVARVDGAIRSYRVSRIRSAAPTGESFVRPDDFDLATHWAAAQEEFARSMLRVRARCRIHADHVRYLRLGFEPAAVAEAKESMGEPDSDGWVTVTLASESYDVLAHGILPLGQYAEILDPPPLRERLARTAREMAARYGG